VNQGALQPRSPYREGQQCWQWWYISNVINLHSVIKENFT